MRYDIEKAIVPSDTTRKFGIRYLFIGYRGEYFETLQEAKEFIENDIKQCYEKFGKIDHYGNRFSFEEWLDDISCYFYLGWVIEVDSKGNLLEEFNSYHLKCHLDRYKSYCWKKYNKPWRDL